MSKQFSGFITAPKESAIDYTRPVSGLLLEGTRGETVYKINAGKAIFLDAFSNPSVPTEVAITFPEQIVPLPAELATEPTLYVGLKADRSIVYIPRAPMSTDLGDTLWIGAISSQDGGQTLFSANEIMLDSSPESKLSVDLGAVNVSSSFPRIIAGTTSLETDEILIRIAGRNWHSGAAGRRNPHLSVVPAKSPVFFFELTGQSAIAGSGTEVSFDQWDDDGTLTPVAPGEAIARRLYVGASGTFVLMHGQRKYRNLAEAARNFSGEQFVEPSSISAFMLLAVIVGVSGATDLASSEQALLLSGGKLGNADLGSAVGAPIPLSDIQAEVEATSWLPAEPSAPDSGTAYAAVYVAGQWAGWTQVPAPLPIDTFAAGWSFFGFDAIASVLTLGTPHAACSIGPQAPIINGVAFERSAANTADISLPASGWSGTNWSIQRASSAPIPPIQGINTPRLETTAFADLPDPTFGEVAGVSDLCQASLRRNSYITISNLTVGKRYYYLAFFGSYPGITRATKIEPSDGGDSVSFGVDGVGSILERGIRRYGFTAQSSSISFLKFGPDNNGSYQNGFLCLEVD